MSGGDLAPAVAETHSSVVYFFGDRAYKVKKPLDLGFSDFRTRAAREAVCHREVELNRRLAPDVYLGVSDVTGPDGGGVCDHLVVMRRMPADRRLATLVRAGADVAAGLRQVAHLLATFHAGARRGPEVDEAAGVEATAGRWAANTAELQAFAGRHVAAGEVDEVDRLASRYLAGRRPALDRRIARGRACDGHGDLLADDIFLLDDGPRVLDCIEFSDALRHGDALADVAFLAMDLEHLGRPELAGDLLRTYQELAADTWPASLAHHHVAYRAQVRAKVAAIRADQGDEAAGGRARDLLGLCRRHLEAGRIRLVLVGGLPGSGKSTVAAGIGEALGAVVLRADEVRKELAGLPADRPAPAAFGQGLYTPAATEATYAELRRRAEVALGEGEVVVLDASWGDGAQRAGARAVAERTASDLVELRCELDPAVAAVRMRERRRRGGDPSDADAAVAAAMAARADPWPEATTLDAAPAPEVVLRAALAALAAR